MVASVYWHLQHVCLQLLLKCHSRCWQGVVGVGCDPQHMQSVSVPLVLGLLLVREGAKHAAGCMLFLACFGGCEVVQVCVQNCGYQLVDPAPYTVAGVGCDVNKCDVPRVWGSRCGGQGYQYQWCLVDTMRHSFDCHFLSWLCWWWWCTCN